MEELGHRRKCRQCRQTVWVQIRTPFLPTYVNLGQLLNPSVPRTSQHSPRGVEEHHLIQAPLRSANDCKDRPISPWDSPP